jgi:sugar phosphate isomerase/epimerase
MDRREFFQKSVVATLAAKVLSDVTLGRAQTPPAAPGQTPAPPGAATAPPTPRPLILDAYSRFLHWLRTADEVAEATIEITCGGLMVTVGTGTAHVDIANVKTALPAFVNAIRKHGLKVRQIRGGGQTAVDANVEALVGAMGQLGVTHYWLGTDNYDLTKPILPQLDAIKLKVEKFVQLNQKHGTTLMYHTRAGASSVGSVVWDLLSVLKDFDPKYVGFHWDTGHMALHGDMWETLMRTAGPYVVALSWKDRSWQQNLGFLGEGGPYPGPQPAAGAAAAGGRGGRGGRGAGPGGGAPPPGAGGAGRAGGDPAAAGGRGAAAAQAGGEEGAPPAGRGRGGRGGGPRPFPLPLAGNTFARGGGWTSPQVPMGTGLVDIFRYAVVMRDIGFNGPMELEAEYPLGGAQSGADKITLPREMVLGSLKRDVLTIRAALAQSGTGLTI